MFTLSIILGSVLLFAANLLIWINSTVFDSDEFTESVDQVLEEPAVKDRITEVLVQQALESGEVEQAIVDRLPEELEVLEPVVGAGLQPALERVVRPLLDSDLVGDLRNEVLLRVHRQVVATLEDDETALEVQGDALVLDLSELFDRLLERFNVEPPERLGGADAPSRILGGDGVIVLTEDTTGLREAAFFTQNRVEIAVLLLAGSAVGFGAAIFFFGERRRGVRATGYAIVGVGILTLLVVLIANQVLESSAEERVVLREGVKALETNLRLQSVALIVLGACAIALTDQNILGWAAKLEAQVTPLVKRMDAKVWLAIAALMTLVLVWV
jgi:hypothetical protein